MGGFSQIRPEIVTLWMAIEGLRFRVRVGVRIRISVRPEIEIHRSLTGYWRVKV
jgi:hypothetical protein